MIRVALVGEYPMDENRIVGGPQSVFVNLVEGLKEHRELELHVVSCRKEISETVRIAKDRVFHSFLPHPHLPMELAYPLLKRRIKKEIRRIGPDLVHAQQFLPVFGPICLDSGLPTVATAHNVPGTEPRFAPNLFRGLRLDLHEKWNGRKFLPGIRHVISISEYVRQGMAGRTKAKFHPVDNPVCEPFFTVPGHSSPPHRLLFVGMFKPIKRPDMAIRVLARARKRVPDLTLLMAGSSPYPRYQAGLAKWISGHDLQDAVTMPGQLDERRLLQEYRDAGILVLTSNLETAPMCVLQAMAAARPVVATAVGGVPYIIEDGKNGILVDPGDEEGLAEAVVRLLRDEAHYHAISHGARETARNRFRNNVVARKMMDVYTQVLADEPVVIPP